jgi:poly-gamma-glutamate capsule biosynthesis protein CapA/YwtB (metallophosphatase superfamily)
MLSRGVAAQIRDRGDPALVFTGMQPVFSRVDFVFANLEFPFAQKTVVPVRGNVFNAPSEWVEGLVDHRFRVLNLANNHAMDQGEQGLFDTISLLRSRGLSPFGAGKNEAEAWVPAEIEVEGIRIGFVGASYASINDSGDTWLRFVARIEDKPRLQRAIAELRTRVDFVVATMHAGIEYVPVPFGPQILFGKAAIDAGADIVIGAHPHVVQPVEIYKGRYIFHSLGNFIFDQTDRHTDEGAALEITLMRGEEGDPHAVRLARLEVLPVVIVDAAPQPASEPTAGDILGRMKLSAAALPPYPSTNN